MGDVTALMMDVITEKSGHALVPMAVSVCLTPAAPAPLPIPYPVFASSIEGIGDAPMRTKINGAKIGTVGSVLKTCHGNEPGTLKEVVSLNTTGPCFLVLGAPIVLCELGMMGITGSLCMQNTAPTPGAGGSASNAGGTGGPGGGG
ncbi:MAG: PAAR-like domain-containing protein, partial [Byssovorax sp.]